MEWLLGTRWNAGKFKTTLKLGVKRMQLVANKGEADRRAKEKEVAKLIREGSLELARIQCETLLRLRDEKEVMEKLTVYSELAAARAAVIDASKEMPIELSVPLCSLVFSAPRFQNIDEMETIAKLLTAKFGKPFAEAARANEMSCVDPSIVHRLGGGTPDPFLVSVMMRKVAAQYNVPYEPDDEEEAARFDEAVRFVEGGAVAGDDVLVGSVEGLPAADIERLVALMGGAGRKNASEKPPSSPSGNQGSQKGSQKGSQDDRGIDTSLPAPKSRFAGSKGEEEEVRKAGSDAQTETCDFSVQAGGAMEPGERKAVSHGDAVVDHGDGRVSQGTGMEHGKESDTCEGDSDLHPNGDGEDGGGDDDGSPAPSAPPFGQPSSDSPPDYDDLAARFEALKRK